MNPEELEKLLASIKAITDALASDMSEKFTAMDAKHTALSDSVTKLQKKADTAGERDRGIDTSMRRREDEDEDPNPHAARRVAADAVDPAVFASLARSVIEMKKNQSRPMNANELADAQAKADSVMRAHNERADPPMAGEDLVAYQIRLARKMQPHSKRWKGVDLQLIAPDRQAFNNVLDEIRSDAMAASMDTTGMPIFHHRKITKTMPGGHIVHEFIGNGTIFKQLSRPVRHVSYIGTRTQQHTERGW